MDDRSAPYYKSKVFHRGITIGFSQLTFITITSIITSAISISAADTRKYQNCCNQKTIGNAPCPDECSTQNLLPRKLILKVGGDDIVYLSFIFLSVIMFLPLWINGRALGRKLKFSVPYMVITTLLCAICVAFMLSSIGIGSFADGSDNCYTGSKYGWNCIFYWTFLELYIGFSVLFLVKIALMLCGTHKARRKIPGYLAGISLVACLIVYPNYSDKSSYWASLLIMLVLVLLSSYTYAKEVHDFAMETKFELTDKRDVILVAMYFFQFGVLIPIELVRRCLVFYQQKVFNAWPISKNEKGRSEYFESQEDIYYSMKS